MITSAGAAHGSEHVKILLDSPSSIPEAGFQGTSKALAQIIVDSSSLSASSMVGSEGI